jgi:hypothetical protein
MTNRTEKKTKTVTVKGWAILLANGTIADQWDTRRTAFTKRIYNTAESARNQLRKLPPITFPEYTEVTITYQLPTTKKKV